MKKIHQQGSQVQLAFFWIPQRHLAPLQSAIVYIPHQSEAPDFQDSEKLWNLFHSPHCRYTPLSGLYEAKPLLQTI